MNRRAKDILFLLIGLLVIVIINIISASFFTRFDLTEEKRFTLSNETIKHLESLEDEVVVKVYLEGDLNAGFLRLKNETKEMLQEFEAYANNAFTIEFIDPYTLNKDPQKVFNQLAQVGLQPTNVQVRSESGVEEQYLFPGAVVYYKGDSRAVQLLKSEVQLAPEVALNKSIEALEFEFSNTLRKLLYPNKEKVAFTIGHGELSDEEIWHFASSLQEYYDVFETIGDTLTKSTRQVIARVNLKKENNQLDLDALKGYKAIIIAGPKDDFSDDEAYLIDQFIMNGGKVLWALDGTTASMDSLETGRIAMAFPLQSKLQSLLYKYGARINNNLIQDLTCGPVPVFDGYQGNQPRFTRYPWIYDPLIISQNTHIINTNLDPIRTSFVSSIDTIPVPNVTKTPILTSSANTKVLRTPIRVSLQTAVRQPNPSSFNDGEKFVGVLLSGTFTSYFKNILTPELQNNPEFPFKSVSSENKMIVLSDATILKNEITKDGRPYPMSVNKFYRDMYYDNKKLALNMMNYLCDDEDLIPMRSRKIELRLLDKKEIKENAPFWRGINLVGPLLIMLFITLPIILIRKIKYSK